MIIGGVELINRDRTLLPWLLQFPGEEFPLDRFGREFGHLNDLRLHRSAVDRHLQALTLGRACVVGWTVDALQLDLVFDGSIREAVLGRGSKGRSDQLRDTIPT
jgi:hypothetical protein